MREVYSFTNIASLYRSNLWGKLSHSKNFKFHFYFGKIKSSGIKEIDFASGNLKSKSDQFHSVRNYLLLNKYLFWQSGVISTCIQKKMFSAIFLGNFFVLSTWIAVLICKLRGIKTVFWGHGMYGNETGLKRIVRLAFNKLPDNHLLYERRAKKLMVESGFNPEKLHVVFNSLDYEKMLGFRDNYKVNKLDLAIFFTNPELPYIIFTGRLTKVKKLLLLLEALNQLIMDGKNINLLMIGEGPEKEILLEYAIKQGITDYIHFYGPCYSEEKLSLLISQAEICVSPGNVGLTAVHSLSYGTPVCTHNNVHNQMPEMEAIEEGSTGIFFEENNEEALARAIEEWIFLNPRSRASIRDDCYKIIDSYYNPNYQLKVFENLLNDCKPFI